MKIKDTVTVPKDMQSRIDKTGSGVIYGTEYGRQVKQGRDEKKPVVLSG